MTQKQLNVLVNNFVAEHEGEIVGYPSVSYNGECLSLVKVYIKEVFGINPPPSGSNSAYGYWSNFPSPLDTVFEKIPNTNTSIPNKGDIIIWKPWTGNPYGHIDICIDDSATVDRFKGFDANWGGRDAHTVEHDYNNVIGYLRPKLEVENDMTDEQKRILDFIGNRTEGDVRQAFGALQDLPNLNKEIDGLKESQKSMEDRLSQLEADAKANNKLIESYQSQLSTAKSRESKLLEQLDAEKAVSSSWKQRYEAALKKFPSSYTWKDIINLIVKKLKNE